MTQTTMHICISYDVSYDVRCKTTPYDNSTCDLMKIIRMFLNKVWVLLYYYKVWVKYLYTFTHKAGQKA